MRPGVPWNVKGIEAEAREMAQLAARRAGVSLGDWLTQVIMTEGRGSPQQHYVPGDGTYGPQPQPYYQPQPQQQYQPQVPSLRYPQAFPQQQPPSYTPAHPHTFQQHPNAAPPPPPQYQQHQPQAFARDPVANAAQMLDTQIRGSEFAVVAHGLRDMADRLENTERRAQQSIASVNQSVAAMQDRIDAAERVKQLADVAFTSAADALAQSARDQSVAFDSLESTMRALQKRLTEVETGRADVLNKDALSRLDTALEQLQKRLNEMRSDVADNDKRSREDLNQISKFMRDLSSRVDSAERFASQPSGADKSLVDSVGARVDALEARAASQFDELRGAIAKGNAQPDAVVALKRSVDALDSRAASQFDELRGAIAKGSTPPDAVVALRRSVDALTARIDAVGDAEDGPLAGPIGAIESTLETLTSKIEESDKRAAESASTVSAVLKSFSSRLEDADKRQTQSTQALARKVDDSGHAVEDALKALTHRLEASDKKHKEAIGGLRLTVDGLVARAASEALPAEPRPAWVSSTASALSAATIFDAPPVGPATRELPPFTTTTAQMLSDAPPPAFDAGLPPMAPSKDDGERYSVSALQTIMAGTLSTPPPSGEFPRLEADERFEHDTIAFDGGADGLPKKADDFLTQARRAAQAAAAQADLERPPNKRGAFASTGENGGRNVGRLMIVSLAIIALVAGIVALLFTLPSGDDNETNRPDAGASIGEILNTPGEPSARAPAQPVTPAPAAEFAPLPSGAEAEAAGVASVAAEPNGMGVATGEPVAPEFTSGTTALPGGPTPASDTTIASLEAAAVRGDAKSQLMLALRYAEGRGVDKDDAKALSLVTKAAQQGYVVAEYRLGAIFERGVGVPKDLAQARTWYERAAKSGSRKAMHNLAVLYADGVGIPQNFPEAARWFRQGADFGLADSQYNLAVLLERGMGVEKNANEAAKWYAVASSQGDSGAAERLEALKRTMSPADIAVALDAARKFKPKPLDPSANEAPNTSG